MKTTLKITSQINSYYRIKLYLSFQNNWIECKLELYTHFRYYSLS